jgi:uncharacterized protein (TIGR03435 family)
VGGWSIAPGLQAPGLRDEHGAAAEGLAAAGVELPPPDPDAPDLFTAIREQLGLKLEATKGPVEVLVIDSIEMATPD